MNCGTKGKVLTGLLSQIPLLLSCLHAVHLAILPHLCTILKHNKEQKNDN